MECPKCGSNNVSKNGTRGDKQQIICKDCGKTSLIFTDGVSPPSINGNLKGISMDEFRSKHDNKYIIFSKVGDLQIGTLVPENKFIEYCKINRSGGYRESVNHEDFEQYRGKASGVTYWSHPNTIAKLKSDSLLS